MTKIGGKSPVQQCTPVQQSPVQQVPAPPPPPAQVPPGKVPQVPPGKRPPTLPPLPTPNPGSGNRFDAKPWLIGAGIAAAGVAGALVIHDGARNLRALRATSNAFESGAMHQGGLQAITDAGLGARFTRGIGLPDRLLVATPIVNRIGVGGRLTSVARGHLDHAELLASATALQRTGDGVAAVHEPMRASVLSQLESGRSLPSVLDDLKRSAGGARPYFTNPRLASYWDNASVVETGKRIGDDVTSAITVRRPELAIADRQIVETGHGDRSIDRVVTGRGSRLGNRGLASGIGSLQAANVATLPPALRAKALEASGIDQSLVDAIGLRGAFVQRWDSRLAG